VAFGISWAIAYMQVCTLLQTDNHASTSPLSFFTGRMPFLPANQSGMSRRVWWCGGVNWALQFRVFNSGTR